MRSALLSPRVATLLVLVAGSAFAAQYETEIEIENETDLYELNQRGDISDSTLDTLIELIRTGVDLNNASREELYELPNITYAEVDQIIEYRKRVTNIDDPADLVRVNALTEKQLLQIAPFLIIAPPAGLTVPVGGVVKAVSMYTVEDPYPPIAYLQARVKGPLGLSGGILAVGTRRRIGELQWGPTPSDVVPPSIRSDHPNSFSATAPRYGLEIPKFFLQWKAAQRSVVVGTFRLGFGQRLTLDNTTRQTPDGIYVDDAVRSNLRGLSGFCRITGSGDDPDCTPEEDRQYVTPDFTWQIPFRGVAGTIRDLDIGDMTLALTGFASYQSRNLYQYRAFNTDQCADPRSQDNECSSPPVFLRFDDGSVSATRYKFQTLPELFHEATGGAHANLELGPGRRVGVTGYYSRPLQKFPNIDFQEYHQLPYGGAFGAVGIDGALALDHLNLFIEGARSFDSTPGGGGGFGVIQRTVFSIPKQEFELSLRFYDRKFANPYSHAIAQSDQLDGQRVRNEAGARLRYLGRPLPDLTTRFTLDVWTLPFDGKAANTAGTTNAFASVRGDFVGWNFFRPGLAIEYRNRGLLDADTSGDDPTTNQNEVCYEVSTSTDSEGDSLPCDGQYFRVIQRLQFVPVRDYLTILLQAQEKLVNDPAYEGGSGYRSDLSVFLQLSSRPTENIRLRGRVKYLDEGLFDTTPAPGSVVVASNEVGESSLWSLADVAYVWPRKGEIRLRYDNYVWLDNRQATLTRHPNPEHRLRLEVEGRF